MTMGEGDGRGESVDEDSCKERDKERKSETPPPRDRDSRSSALLLTASSLTAYFGHSASSLTPGSPPWPRSCPSAELDLVTLLCMVGKLIHSVECFLAVRDEAVVAGLVVLLHVAAVVSGTAEGCTADRAGMAFLTA